MSANIYRSSFCQTVLVCVGRGTRDMRKSLPSHFFLTNGPCFLLGISMHFPCYYVRRKPVSQNIGVVHITNERFYIQRIPEEKNLANSKKKDCY